MARRVGRLPTPWTVSTPHRPSGISVLSNFYDRQVLFTGIPAVPAAGNRRRVNLRKKTRERAHPCGASSGFSCLCSSRLSCFRCAALGAGFISSSRRWAYSTSCLRNLCRKSPIQMACVHEPFIPVQLPAAVRSREKWMQENGSWKRPKSKCRHTIWWLHVIS